MDNGSYKIVKTENGELLFHIKQKTPANYSILSTSWINYLPIKKLEKINPFKKSQMLDALIPQLGPQLGSDRYLRY